MIQVLNPRTKKAFTINVQHCLDHAVVVEVARDGRVIKVPYEDIRYVSDDWYRLQPDQAT